MHLTGRSVFNARTATDLVRNSRWFAVAILFLLPIGCRDTSIQQPKLPDSASFGWKLAGIVETKPENAPELIRAVGFQKSWRAEYRGDGTASVDVYRTKSRAAGLDLTQRWRASAQTVTVFNDSYFVVISWRGANRAAATALVGQIERNLPHSE